LFQQVVNDVSGSIQVCRIRPLSAERTAHPSQAAFRTPKDLRPWVHRNRSARLKIGPVKSCPSRWTASPPLS